MVSIEMGNTFREKKISHLFRIPFVGKNAKCVAIFRESIEIPHRFASFRQKCENYLKNFAKYEKTFSRNLAFFCDCFCYLETTIKSYDQTYIANIKVKIKSTCCKYKYKDQVYLL